MSSQTYPFVPSIDNFIDCRDEIYRCSVTMPAHFCRTHNKILCYFPEILHLTLNSIKHEHKEIYGTKLYYLFNNIKFLTIFFFQNTYFVFTQVGFILSKKPCRKYKKHKDRVSITLIVGMRGFEPPTPRPPDVYSNRTELHPAIKHTTQTANTHLDRIFCDIE